MKRKLKIALLWHTFGHGNLGVDALARGNAIMLERAARQIGIDLAFVTLGSGQNFSPRDLPDNVTIGPAPRIKPLLKGQSPFLAELRSCDLVVDIGEGDSWTDIYGLKRFAFHSGTKIAALLLGRPLVLSPQTIGPFDKAITRRIAASVMNRATAVFSRDDLSTAFLNKINNRSYTREFIDVAFALPFEKRPRSESKRRVGINVSGLLYNGGYTGDNEFGMKLDYARYTHALIERFTSLKDVEVHLFAHVGSGSGNDDDHLVVERLAQRYPNVCYPPKFSTAIEAKTFISGLDFVVAGRMHACIAAFSAGVPVVPVAYSRKFNGLFGTLKYPFLVDGKVSQTDDAINNTISWFDNRQELQEATQTGILEANTRLAAYQDELARTLIAVANNG